MAFTNPEAYKQYKKNKNAKTYTSETFSDDVTAKVGKSSEEIAELLNASPTDEIDDSFPSDPIIIKS
jgi:phosphoribosyl-ATP pyrophosphohydrolase